MRILYERHLPKHVGALEWGKGAWATIEGTTDRFPPGPEDSINVEYAEENEFAVLTRDRDFFELTDADVVFLYLDTFRTSAPEDLTAAIATSDGSYSDHSDNVRKRAR